jgi:YD repeat-containing protein
MVINIFSFLLIGLTSGTVSHLHNSDFAAKQKQDIVKNKIKAVTGYTYSFAKGKLQKKGIKSSLELFDENGNLTSESFFNERGETYYEYSHYYNADGIEIKSVGIERNKPFYNIWVYSVNDSLNTFTRHHEKTKINKQKWITYFDKNGVKIKQEQYDKEGLFAFTTLFAYNAAGQLTTKTEVDGYGNAYKIYNYTYDKKGYIATMTESYADNVIYLQHKYGYDKMHNLTSHTISNARGEATNMTLFTYNYYK